MHVSELTATTATELARLVREGTVSAAEIAEAHLHRIEAVDGVLNAVVALDGERALDAARDRTRMLAWGERYDLLLSSVFGGPAPRHGELAGHEGADSTGFTPPHRLRGGPAATVRCGSSPEGLPIGMQLVARPWRDDVALAAAAALEAALGGRHPPPL